MAIQYYDGINIIGGFKVGDSLAYSSFEVEAGGDILVNTVLKVSDDFELSGAFYDSNNQAGTSGQVLSSTGTGTDWIDAGGPYLPLAGGTMTGTSGVLMPDNFKLKFGNATTPDLEIYHDGNHSRIKDAGQGHLTINATDFVVNNSADTKNMIIATDGGSVNLYYNASQKFRTLSAGVEVTGNIDLPSNGAILFDNTNNTEQYYIRNGGGSQSSFQIGKGNPGSDIKLIIDDGGKVGIGTTSPSEKLEVNSGTTNVTSVFKSSDNQAWISIQDDDSGTYGALIGTDTDANNDFVIADQSANKTFVINAGNVGIGTTSPNAKLEVDGDVKFTNTLSIESEYPRINLTDTNNNSDYSIINANGNFRVYDVSNAANRMSINSSGNVGIGTTSPSAKLEVDGEALFGNGTDGLLLSYSSGNSSGIIDTGHSSTALEFRVGNTQELLINSTSASFAGNVDVNGNLSVEDEIHLTDGGTTVRGKLLLNSSDRDNVELRAESLGSTMKFFTVGTEALELDASQNATFAGDVTADSFTGVLQGAVTGAPDATIWRVSAQYPTWGIFYDEGNPDKIQFKANGNTSATISLDNGDYTGRNATFAGDVTADSFIKDGGTSSQYLMADGSVSTSSGGSSPWTTDTHGITYTSGNVGIGMASVYNIDLAVDGFVRFYDQLRVNSNAQLDAELSVGGDTSLGGELSLNGNDILTEGGDILDNTDSGGTNQQFLISKGTGNGVRWQTLTAGNLDAVTSVTTGEPSGSSAIINIVQISKANYDAADTAGTLVTGTAYLIFA